MTSVRLLPPTRAQRIIPGVFPFASAASAVDRSPPWSPPKSWAWSIEIHGHRTRPTDLWGDCGYRRSDHGDGDENSSREQSLPIGGNKQTDRPQ